MFSELAELLIFVTVCPTSEKIFRSLMVAEYGKSTAARGGIGIADDIIRQMLTTQEVSL